MENLDAMTEEELWEFWKQSSSGRTLAGSLFPDKPKGYVKATKDLGNYAANKATAMRERLKGQIQTAQQYEAICDRIYNQLPEWAHW